MLGANLNKRGRKIMREVFIKYNPYRMETQISIDGKPVKANSALNVDDKRLQEWIEEMPEILVDEYNTKSFNITFQGTLLDYEDVLSVARDAREQGIQLKCQHIAAKEVKDKIKAIEQIFYDIQKGPFEELKQSDVKRAFEMASSSDFEVNVVATMSAGKSTLINALLREKLMPAKQEPCTATITKIKDRDLDSYRATVHDKNGDLIETHEELTFEVMNRLNSNPCVSNIQVEGNIPFVTAEDVALVLVDTPGPNNSRDPEHRATTYRMLSESSKAVVIYIINSGQLAINDDNDLLNHVADSMRVGGKQSKDRFIFVVNKLDEYRKDEDSVAGSLEKVRKYLEDKGIINPNIFPAAALPALDIRSYLRKGDKTDEDLAFEVEYKARKLNKNKDIHLETYAPLTPSLRGEITEALAKAQEENNAYEEALIHTGITSIEAAIKMYVAKYAKTAKIKNIVDTFAKKLESARSFENTKQEIAANQEKQQEILEQIKAIQEKLKSGEEAKEFKDKIEAISYEKEILKIAGEITGEAQKKISAQCENMDSKLNLKDAESICQVFTKFAENLQAEVEVKLENAVTKHVMKNAQDLLDQYKQRISNLDREISVGSVKVTPFELMNGDFTELTNMNSLIKKVSKTESVKVDEVWVSNTSRKWYKPWTWGQEKGHYKAIYEDREYIDGSELAQKFFAPIKKQLFDNGDNAAKYAKGQVQNIKAVFIEEFEKLDEVLNGKLAELKACASDSENVENLIKSTEKRLAWLEQIQARTQAILDI
jgi:GTPase Era involved in 16S rRNA processing